MGIYSVFIINKAGGLIFQYDHYSQRPEIEKTFSFPIELVLKQHDEKLVVAFGERDGIKGDNCMFCTMLRLIILSHNLDNLTSFRSEASFDT